MDKPIFTIFETFTAREHREIVDEQKILKNCSQLGPGEGGCCSSGTKHDRRKVSRAELLSLDRRVQKRRL
jgi:hypothetical protein